MCEMCEHCELPSGSVGQEVACVFEGFLRGVRAKPAPNFVAARRAKLEAELTTFH